MKRLFVALFAGFIGLGMFVQDAEAKRLGGGRSAGMQRDNVMQRQATPPTAAPQQQAAPGQSAAAAQTQSGARRWLGPLAGLAAGIGLAALLSHFGLGEAFASFLMLALLALAVIVVLRLLMRKKAAAQGGPMQYAGAGPSGYAPPPPAGMAGASAAAQPIAARQPFVPADFDVEGFVRQAKLNFVRLQAANDAGNLEDIREFTTPEMFAEIRLDMQERADTPQHTDVVTLNAEVLDVAEEAQRYVASVRFSGTIREQADAQPEPFEEVWHLTKPVSGGGWVIAGIQQAK